VAKRRITPERREQRKKLLEMLQDAGINDVAGVQELFKEMVGTVLQNALEAVLDEELGYSKYDYRNKQTDNSRNGYSEKTMKTSFGDMIWPSPGIGKANLIPSSSRNNRLPCLVISKKRSCPCMLKA